MTATELRAALAGKAGEKQVGALAMEVARERAATQKEVRKRKGTIYEGAPVTWRFFNGKDITIRPAPGQADLPTFDRCRPTGCGERRRFVTVAGSSGENTRIHFRALRVQNYWEGISFSGSSTELDGWNGGNSVKDCVFEKMGNKYIEDNDGAYATVRLQMSRNNVLTGNRFYKIENTNGGKVKDTYLHAFYIAYKSSHNLIKGNVFEGRRAHQWLLQGHHRRCGRHQRRRPHHGALEGSWRLHCDKQ